MKKSELDYEVIIIGGGPGGLTAAIYTSRALRKTLLIEKVMMGGMMSTTDIVENYPGFPDGINGFDLGMLMHKQAEKFGTEYLYDEVIKVELEGEIKKVFTANKEFKCASVIISTGSSFRKLGVPGERELIGKGVSFCATCDAPFFKAKEVAVIGGGDTAVEEAIYLTKFASKVYIIHRRDKFRAAKNYQNEAFKNPKIEILWDTIPTEILGSEKVNGIKLKNLKTDQESQLSVEGVFVFIGALPNTFFFKGQIDLDEYGYVITDRKMQTNVKGVFACGDVIAKVVGQVATCVGEGSVAGYCADQYVEEALEYEQ